MRNYILGFLLLAGFFYSCNSNQKKNEKASSDVDGPIEKAEIKYAKGFAISKYSDYYRLQLFSPFRDREDTLNFILGNSSDKTKFPPEYKVIEAPVSSVALLASPHSAFLQALEMTHVVKGISTREYFFNETIQERVDSGDIIELGFGQNINTEKLIVLSPQLLMFSGMSSSDEARYGTISNAGTVLFPVAEWQENHPLGRAEWIKVFGLLTGKYGLSLKVFKEIEERYLKLASEEINSDYLPSVIVNAPYKDVWWLPGGNSYVSKIIGDAGARYAWQDNQEEGGVQIDIETIFDTAHDADFWINPGQFKSKEELLDQDSRYKEFAAFQNNNVYNNDLRVNKFGGNDYYETGLVRPDFILADMVKIFHPEAMPHHEFFFYRKLP